MQTDKGAVPNDGERLHSVKLLLKKGTQVLLELRQVEANLFGHVHQQDHPAQGQ